MNRIIYFFRNKKAGFSIESLFTTLAVAVGSSRLYEVAEAYVPTFLPTVHGMWQNLMFARHQRAAIYHITGDVHYLALALPPANTILTIHDCVSLAKYKQQKSYLRYVALWLLYYYLPMRRLRYMTTISEKSRQELSRLIGPRLSRKVRVIPNHYNPDFTSKPKPFNNANPVILHIGTGDHKNLPRLIQALTDVPCTLVIVGRLSASQSELLIRSGVAYSQKVALTVAEMIAEYEACDIVSFVSLYEGFGMPIIEANVVGRAVITSAISPMLNVAGDAAVLVDPYSTEAIRAGILRLINDDMYREQLIEAGFLNAALYTVQRASAQYIALYEEMLLNLTPND